MPFIVLFRSVSWAADQYIRMISEGSCDTEDWRNDAENSALITGINDIKKIIQNAHTYLNLLFIYLSCTVLLSVFSQKNAAFMQVNFFELFFLTLCNEGPYSESITYYLSSLLLCSARGLIWNKYLQLFITSHRWQQHRQHHLLSSRWKNRKRGVDEGKQTCDFWWPYNSLRWQENSDHR